MTSSPKTYQELRASNPTNFSRGSFNNAKARVWCRSCGDEMLQADYGILAFYCQRCKLKATVAYDKTPTLVPLGDTHFTPIDDWLTIQERIKTMRDGGIIDRRWKGRR